MSLTSTSSRPCSASMRATSARDLLGLEVVDRDRDPLPARRGHQLRGLLDRLGAVDLRAPLARAAAGRVDRRARLAERDRDAAPAAAGRARDQRDLAVSGRSCRDSRSHRDAPHRITTAASTSAPPASWTAPSVSPKTRKASTTVDERLDGGRGSTPSSGRRAAARRRRGDRADGRDDREAGEPAPAGGGQRAGPQLAEQRRSRARASPPRRCRRASRARAGRTRAGDAAR